MAQYQSRNSYNGRLSVSDRLYFDRDLGWSLAKQLTPTLFILLFVLALYGVIGFLDDFIKIFKKRNMGLNSKQKLIGQVLGESSFILFTVLKAIQVY
ncbi:hypothetical protein NWO25_05165 [Enterococcus lactis]|nr:hypothetical protein [Enterococcus lactis]